MELIVHSEFEEYIRRNYELLYESENNEFDLNFPGTCDICQREVFFKIYSKLYQSLFRSGDGLPRFVTIYTECPKCRGKSFTTTVQFQTRTRIEDEWKDIHQYYKIFRLPTAEESYANKDIPEEYTSLRDTVSEAGFCLSHSRNIAAAILFRRAIQILAKDVLGASGRTLNDQLKWLKVNPNRLIIDLNHVFHDNARIIKDIGNQGAHPDDDITLHNFSKQDAEGLHDLFISIVHEVFVKPAKIRALQEELRQSRKLKP